MADNRNLFDRFGGVRPMAIALGEPPSTVASWKASGRIPATKQREVLRRGAELSLELTAADVVYPLDRRADLPIEEKLSVASRHVACDAPDASHWSVVA